MINNLTKDACQEIINNCKDWEVNKKVHYQKLIKSEDECNCVEIGTSFCCGIKNEPDRFFTVVCTKCNNKEIKCIHQNNYGDELIELFNCNCNNKDTERERERDKTFSIISKPITLNLSN